MRDVNVMLKKEITKIVQSHEVKYQTETPRVSKTIKEKLANVQCLT